MSTDPVAPAELAAAGLGVQYATLRLVRAKAAWGPLADRLAGAVAKVVGDAAVAVEHVGSTAVPGLLGKPILDLAIGVHPGTTVEALAEPLARRGWISRGDAGEDGGWVFVLEDEPWHRVAHAHGVEHGGRQWERYLRFRDLLRGDASARAAYEAAKRDLAARHPDGRQAYTAGKDPTVRRLLGDDPRRAR